VTTPRISRIPMRISRPWPFLAALALLAAAPDLRAQATAPDPRACRVAREAGEDDVAYAVRCAEEFVRRNGYTTEPADPDTTQHAAESIERRSPSERLAMRAGSLESRAYAICEGEGAHRFTVVFRIRRLDVHGVARRVTMSANFGEMRMQHLDIRLNSVTKRHHGCRPLDAGTTP
jgi:hypothetical protein